MSDLIAREQIFNDELSPSPTGFSKITPSEAAELYDACIQLKLRPPAHSGGGVGGGGGSFFDSSGPDPFWYIEFLRWQSKYCPWGDCRK